MTHSGSYASSTNLMREFLHNRDVAFRFLVRKTTNNDSPPLEFYNIILARALQIHKLRSFPFELMEKGAGSSKK